MIVKETFWRDDLNFVGHAPMIYVNFIIIVIMTKLFVPELSFLILAHPVYKM